MRFFSKVRRKPLLYAAGGAVLIIILIIVIISAGKNGNGKTREIVAESRRLPVDELNPDDLIIPKALTEVWRQDWVPFREQKKVWTEEDIKPYWSDTREVLLEVLEKQTVDTLMRNLSPAPSGRAKK